MGEPKHFQCTACGKCCYGQLPLTYKDAFTFAGLFPLALIWTPVQKGSKDYKRVRELGIVIPLSDGIELAAFIVPTAFIPKSFPCPALVNQKLCGIHDVKPSRCKAMPFYPYREERFQGELLQPKPDWECDTSPNAPVLFEGNKILFRDEYDKENHDLLEQVPMVRRYGEYMLKHADGLPHRLWVASTQSKGAQVVTSLSSLLTAIRHPEAREIAQRQWPVLVDYAVKTSKDPKLKDFHAYYVSWGKEMAHVARMPTKESSFTA